MNKSIPHTPDSVISPATPSTSSAAERGRSPSGAAELVEGARRFYAKDKIQAVHKLLRGESLSLVSRELGVPASTLTSWKKTFLALGASGFSKNTKKTQDASTQRLNAKIGELSMENELLREKIAKLEEKSPLALRRSKS